MGKKLDMVGVAYQRMTYTMSLQRQREPLRTHLFCKELIPKLYSIYNATNHVKRWHRGKKHNRITKYEEPKNSPNIQKSLVRKKCIFIMRKMKFWPNLNNTSYTSVDEIRKSDKTDVFKIKKDKFKWMWMIYDLEHGWH